MRENEFRQYLGNQGLTYNGVNARLSWCRRVENDFGVDLDNVVETEEGIQDLRRKVYNNANYTERQRSNFPNGLKKYFEFVHGYELPKINNYD